MSDQPTTCSDEESKNVDSIEVRKTSRSLFQRLDASRSFLNRGVDLIGGWMVSLYQGVGLSLQMVVGRRQRVDISAVVLQSIKVKQLPRNARFFPSARAVPGVAAEAIQRRRCRPRLPFSTSIRRCDAVEAEAPCSRRGNVAARGSSTATACVLPPKCQPGKTRGYFYYV